MNDDPMTKIIPFAVNKQQKKSIEHAANEAEVTVSTYCREAVLKRIENERRSYKTFECSECGDGKCILTLSDADATTVFMLGIENNCRCILQCPIKTDEENDCKCKFVLVHEHYTQ
jgi:hypothetical protein